MKKTIMSVNTEPNLWEGKHGTLAFITVTFEDGDQGSVACKPDNADRVIGILEGLERKEFEYELQAKDDYNGIPQWKVMSYPGKPGAQQDGAGSGGGGSAQRSASGKGGGWKSSPEDRSSIEAQVAAKIAGEIAVALIQAKQMTTGGPVAVITDAIPQIARAIRSAAKDSGSESRPSGGPLSTSGPDEAEGGAPASPSGWGEPKPATAKQKAKANMQYGGAGKLMIAAKAMFPEVTKVGDLTEDQMAALIEDKGQG